MHLIRLTYILRNGARGTLECLCRGTADAVCIAIDTFGDRLRTCSAKAVL